MSGPTPCEQCTTSSDHSAGLRTNSPHGTSFNDVTFSAANAQAHVRQPSPHSRKLNHF